MSHSQFHYISQFILTLAWLSLWDKHITTGRINQVIPHFRQKFSPTNLQLLPIMNDLSKFSTTELTFPTICIIPKWIRNILGVHLSSLLIINYCTHSRMHTLIYNLLDDEVVFSINVKRRFTHTELSYQYNEEVELAVKLQNETSGCESCYMLIACS
jgi:hypothetical protein